MIKAHSNGDVEIDGIVITDPVLSRLMSAHESQDDRAAVFADVAEIGARMYQRQVDGQAGDIVRQELDRVRDQLSHDVEVLLSGAGEGFAQVLRPVMGEIAQQLALMAGRIEGASQAQAELDRERDRGTAKGRPFEEDVAAAVQSVANHNGDSCEHVGDVSTSLSGRAGDVVVEVGGADGPSRGRIVFEAKTGRLSRPEAMRELDRARETRDADYAVLVVQRPEKMPANVREFHEYGGDKMVVVFDSDPTMRAVGLEVGYALARARVLMRRGTEVDGRDFQSAIASLEMAEDHLERARSIKSHLTSISGAAERVAGEIDNMVAAVRLDVVRAMQALR